MEIHQLTALQIRNSLARGQLSCERVNRHLLDRIERIDGQIHSFLCLSREIIERARESDRRYREKKTRTLEGIPVAVKDNICTQDMATTCASRSLSDFISPYDAHVVEKLRAGGAIVVGKTNLDEFAMGSSGENSAVFATHNPWDLKRTPGGSSGGSAAAVAAGLTPLALGSDTGGSVRQPAALCGIVGLKPTYGRVSRFGLVAFASSLEQIGPMARSVEDCALLFQQIAGRDRRDATSAAVSMEKFLPLDRENLRGVRVGIPEHFAPIAAEVDVSFSQAVATFHKLGAEITRLPLAYSKYSTAAYYIIAAAEASSNLSRYDGIRYGYRTEEATDSLEQLYEKNRGESLGPEVKRRILLGTYVLSQGYREAYYKKALQVRTLIRREIEKALDEVDVLLTPTTPTPAFELGEKAHDPLAMYLSDVFTVPFSLSGHPAISVPCGLSAAGLPIGVQIVAKHFAEKQLLEIARAYEMATPQMPYCKIHGKFS